MVLTLFNRAKKRERGRSDDNDARVFLLSNTADKRAELLRIASTYLLGINESGNQKGNLSYLAGTKKRSDFLMQSRKGARAVG
jgi:hypothetical protein